MWFNKLTKQAFVLPPKTGSVTCRYFLHHIGWKFIGEHHAYPSEMISKYPNLADYSIYAFLRDPLARFESCVLFLKQIPRPIDTLSKLLEENNVDKTRETITYDEIVDLFPKFNSYGFVKTVFRPQCLWFDAPNVTALDYQNLESELRRITSNYDTPIKSYNVATNYGRSVITQKVKDFVREQYAADYALIKDRLGKEY
jgi:hypothetical protein